MLDPADEKLLEEEIATPGDSKRQVDKCSSFLCKFIFKNKSSQANVLCCMVCNLLIVYHIQGSS